MLNLAALEATPVAHDPFDHVIVDDFVARAHAPAVSHDYPAIRTTGSYPLSELTYGPAFGALVSDLQGAPFRNAVASRFDLDLASLVPLLTVRGRVGPKDGGVHTDATWKVVTVLLYLNETWEDTGGRLRLLRADDIQQTAIEVVPKWGTLLAFRRSDQSWHGHLPADGERRVVQLNWVTSQAKADAEIARHRRSGWLKRLTGRKPY